MPALTHSPAQVTAQALADLGTASALGGKLDWAAYYAAEPNAPERVLTVFNTAPVADGGGRSMPDGEMLQHWGVQVRVRGRSDEDAWRKADQVRAALTEGNAVVRRAVTIAANAFQGLPAASYEVQCWSRVKVIDMGKNVPSSMRSVVTVNAMVALRQTA